jgi:hypothetical protein
MPVNFPLQTANLSGLGLGVILIFPKIRASSFLFKFLQFNSFLTQVKDAS